MKITLKQILNIIDKNETCVIVTMYKNGQYSEIGNFPYKESRQKELQSIKQYFLNEVKEIYTDTAEWGEYSILYVSINA